MFERDLCLDLGRVHTREPFMWADLCLKGA
jgi:hypothetical protein